MFEWDWTHVSATDDQGIQRTLSLSCNAISSD